MVRRPPFASPPHASLAVVGWLLVPLVLAACAGASQVTPQIIFVTASPAPPTPQIIYVTPSPGPTASTAPTTAPTAAPPSSASDSPSASLAPTASPTSPSSPTPTPPPPPTPTAPPTPTPTPKPTPKPTPSVPTTTVKIVKMALTDPNDIDPIDHTRDLSFTSDGTGQVIIKVSGVAPGQKVKVCAAIGNNAERCQPPTSGITLFGSTTTQKTLWHIRVSGATMGLVTSVDLEATFPAKAPHITLKDFYLSGSSTFPPGIVVDFISRDDCAAGFLVTPDDPSAPVTVELKDISEPGSAPPAPGPECVDPPTGLTPQGTIAGHHYELTVTSSSGDQHYATLELSWP